MPLSPNPPSTVIILAILLSMYRPLPTHSSVTPCNFPPHPHPMVQSSSTTCTYRHRPRPASTTIFSHSHVTSLTPQSDLQNSTVFFGFTIPRPSQREVSMLLTTSTHIRRTASTYIRRRRRHFPPRVNACPNIPATRRSGIGRSTLCFASSH